ncbi:MAG: ABC transporter permease [Clostridiaceae bacterium]|nr:ABC transporter permease [Clostridiaceae bacterium]
MWKFIIKRLLLSVFILFFVALIIYTIMRFIPTSYVDSMAREMSQKQGALSYQELKQQLNSVYGLDDPILIGYFKWLSNAVRGKFGDTWYYTGKVTAKFADVIWNSFFLGAVAFILEVLIAIPLGILSARKQYSKTDYAVTVVALIGISLPTFFFATLLKLVFSVKLGWFELYGSVGKFYNQLSTWGKFLDIASHNVMPIMTLVIVNIGSLMRYTRTNMLEVLNADYIRTARAKGLSESKVINKHAFRNTLIPIVTILGGTIPSLFSGAMITETLFQIEGIGRISYDAMVHGDIPFTMFYLTFLAMLTLLGTLIADIMYAIVDPRVRIS